ncbi:orotate phosphoribosyltransferase-like protein [Methanotorris formicicus]|uniref:Transcriptional regulator GfcR n=1 Tax=Methanotorris formicicus Mc-S-70 TaxID=647171 RepID=H1KXR0_9EURY|nr:orotate phosphoribosyltransferase-like protein [Methanotorris formicicus]EHP87902.1 phosphoribosyltransferase [Methanotorris formicicus Mc-S-70]
MKKKLIKKVIKLKDKGLTIGEIADELNVSMDTALYLVLNAEKLLSEEEAKETPEKRKKLDIFVEWNTVGDSSKRLKHITSIMCDILKDVEFDVVIGIATSGIPLATMISDEMDKKLSIYIPKKHVHDEGKKITGIISQNFSSIEHKNIVIIDDVMTTGSTIKEAIKYLREIANPKMVVVMIDKSGITEIEGIPVVSLFRVGIVEIEDRE